MSDGAAKPQSGAQIAGATLRLEHALPFETIFEEFRAIKPDEFLEGVGKSLFPAKIWKPLSGSEEGYQKAEDALTAALDRHRRAYQRLVNTKQEVHAVDPSLTAAPVDLNPLEQECWAADLPLKRVFYYLRGNALSLSGGGIRSASFSLGVLQGLARFTCHTLGDTQADTAKCGIGLLEDTQYLSTVSGGGYMGSWLSAWIERLAKTTPPISDGDGVCQAAYRKVVQALAGNSEQTSGDPSPETVRHLREFTAYLSPQLGFSLDVWSLVAIIIRNLLVNAILIVPVFLIIVTFPELLVLLQRQMSTWIELSTGPIFFGALAVLIALASFTSGRSLPSYTPLIEARTGRALRCLGFHGVLAVFLFPIMLVAWMLSIHFYPRAIGTTDSPFDAAALSAVAAVGYCTLSLLKWWSYTVRRQEIIAKGGTVTPEPVVAAGLLLFVSTVLSIAMGIAFELVGGRLLPLAKVLQPSGVTPVVDAAGYELLAFPAFLTILLLGSSLFSAFTQKLESEEDREWWARAGGFLMVAGFLWLAGAALTLYGQFGTFVLFGQLQNHATAWMSGSGIALGGLTSWLAKSSQTSAGTRAESESTQSSVAKFLNSRKLLLPALAVLSLAFLAVALVRLGDWMRGKLPYADNPTCSVTLLLIYLVVVVISTNWLININVFSLHGLYRMRLQRAFLGASNNHRHPDPFTDFDKHDSPYMTDLAHSEGVPLHVVCTTLNLVGTKRAEWRQRKAESFTFSAVSAGSWRLNYVPAALYGGSRGVTLATAMAISGAAANPNMGYHSSPLVTLLMALFNVRLGWWLPNPLIPEKLGYDAEAAKRFWRRSGPVVGVLPLLEELFGETDDDGRWIELSDGGHFEDLALYEMVLRRCRNIIVVDAGADPSFNFEDLGNAIRKIEIDLGIPIRFSDGLKMQRGVAGENCYCAVGTIDYGCVDSPCFADKEYETPLSDKALMQGNLIYLKACMNGTEPMDVKEYQLSHPIFPHEPTGNQFFNEAQFESYRHLGSHVVETIGKGAAGSQWSDWVAAATAHGKTIGK